MNIDRNARNMKSVEKTDDRNVAIGHIVIHRAVRVHSITVDLFFFCSAVYLLRHSLMNVLSLQFENMIFCVASDSSLIYQNALCPTTKK